MKRSILVISILALPHLCFGYGDVCITLNGGDNVVYVDQTNTLEIWIENDALLGSLSCGMAVYWEDVTMSWDIGYGSYPPVNVEGRAINVFNLIFGVDQDFDNIPPDNFWIFGSALAGSGMPQGPSDICFTLQFEMWSPKEGDYGQFCVLPIFYEPSGEWLFIDSAGIYPPDFCGEPTGSTSDPQADPACFSIVNPIPCGDVDCSGGVDIDDVVYLVLYIFAGGPPPCDPGRASLAARHVNRPVYEHRFPNSSRQGCGDFNDDGVVNQTDLADLVEFLF